NRDAVLCPAGGIVQQAQHLARRPSDLRHHPETLPVGKAAALLHGDWGISHPGVDRSRDPHHRHLSGRRRGAPAADRGAVDGPDDPGGAVGIIGAGARHRDARTARDEVAGLFVPARYERAMSDLSLSILAETTNDAQAIERLHQRTFGPGRFVLSAYRIRGHVDHLLDLSFPARIGTLLVGSVRQLPICIGDTPALLLGPLTVEPPFRGRGIAKALLERSLDEARK